RWNKKIKSPLPAEPACEKRKGGAGMTREEQKALKRQRLREQRRKEREAWEAARGPLDLPFLLLVLVLLVIGLIMLLSASFPSAQAEPGGDPLAYFKRQGIFAILGLVEIGRAHV